jgi:acyl-CoA thioester hydrolase
MPPFLDPELHRLSPRLKARYGVDDGWTFAMERRARWTEIDGFGHVNHVSFLVYFEDARNCYLECVGLPPLSAETPGPVLARTTVEYTKPLRFEDSFLVTARTRRIGNTSLVMEYAVWREGCVARGEAVCVLMVNATGTKTPIPQEVRAGIAAFEGRSFDRPEKREGGG